MKGRRSACVEKTMIDEPNASSRLTRGGWTMIGILLAFLAAAIAYAIHGWNQLGTVGIPPMGWAFLIAGIVVTLAVGGGLMALLFYSSRKGRDI
jgi:hypothetical protein